ncbi:hypothetical protein VE01_06682, partial [Pseudogymnoascus verrucosus]
MRSMKSARQQLYYKHYDRKVRKRQRGSRLVVPPPKPLLKLQPLLKRPLKEMLSTPPQATTPAKQSPVISSGASASISVNSSSSGPQAQDGEMPLPTAVQVARQLWQFHGCTEEQHQEREEEHTQAHEQPSSLQHACCSLPQVTTLLAGTNIDGSPLNAVPDVLCQHRLIKRGE